MSFKAISLLHKNLFFRVFFSQRGIALGKFCDFRENVEKSWKNTNFSRRLAQLIGGSNRVFKNKNTIFVLKQNCFEKILRFVEKNGDFFDFEPGILILL